MIGIPTIEQAATSTASGNVVINVQPCDRWSVQIDLGGATADIVIYGQVHRDGEWVDVSDADLSGSTASIIQSGEIPLDRIKVAWSSLAGGTIAIYSMLRRALT